MIDVDPLVETALLGSHTVVPRVTALYGTAVIGEVTITDGDVTFDERNAVQGRSTVSVPVPSVQDPNTFDPRYLDVSGWRLFIEYGVQVYPYVYYTPLGTFVNYELNESEDNGQRIITITGYDTTVLLRDARFERPTQVVAGSAYDAALSDLATGAGLSSSFPATNYTTPLLLFVEGDDRLVKMNDMATSVGWQIVADPYGVITAHHDIVPSATNAVIEFVEGQGSRMVSLSRRRSRQQVYNIAVVVGEPAGATAPVYGFAYDDDPHSLTYVTATETGPYGRVPIFEKSQFVTTTDQATVAAQSLVNRKRGIGATLEISSWPHPGLRPGDPVHVRRDRMNINTVVPLSSVTIPLRPGREMKVTTREGTVV